MKSTTAIALVASFIPLAMASPYHMKLHAERDNNVEVEWVTDIAVVTAYAEETVYWTGAPAETTTVSSSAAAIETSTADVKKQHHWTYSHFSYEAPSTSEAPLPTTTPVAAPTLSTTTFVVPTPETTSTIEIPTPSTTSIYTPPVETPTPSTPAYTPPATTQAPVTTAAPASYVNSGAGPFEVPQLAAADATNSNAVPATTLAAYVGSTTGAASYDSSKGDLQAATLNSTNTWRSMFGAAPLTWSDNLEARALMTAQACNWTHSNAGQNYAAGYEGPQSSIDGWGGEYTGYNFSPPDWSESAGHFTQLVWQDTTTVGCAAYNCPADAAGGAHGWFFVCNYLPVGNMLGEFPANVHTKTS